MGVFLLRGKIVERHPHLPTDGVPSTQGGLTEGYEGIGISAKVCMVQVFVCRRRSEMGISEIVLIQFRDAFNFLCFYINNVHLYG